MHRGVRFIGDECQCGRLFVCVSRVTDGVRTLGYLQTCPLFGPLFVLAGRRHPSLEESRGFWERPGLSGGGDDLLRAAGSAVRSLHARL